MLYISGNHKCPQDWNYSSKGIDGGACYIVKRNDLTWEDARDDCLSNNADLVSIANKEEQGYIEELLRSNDDKRMWLGLNDKETEGTWTWTDK